MNTGLPGYCSKGIPVPRVLCHSLTEVTEVPGKGTYGDLTELPGVPGTGTEVIQNSQKFRIHAYRLTEVPGSIKMLYPYPGNMWHGRTELTEVPGTRMNVVQNIRKFRVRV